MFSWEGNKVLPVYIERDFLLKKIAEVQSQHSIGDSERDRGFYDACQIITAFINLMPEGNVLSVVSGMWKWRDGCYHCSNCQATEDHVTRFCPACGTSMIDFD